MLVTFMYEADVQRIIPIKALARSNVVRGFFEP